MSCLEVLGVTVHEESLADRGGRLLRCQSPRPLLQAQWGQTRGDRSGRHQNDLGAPCPGAREDIDQAPDPGGVDAATGGRQ